MIITDTDFVAQLERAYHEPVPGLDEAAAARASLGGVYGADRRRWIVLLVSAVLGAGLAAAGVLAAGPMLAAATADAVASLPTAWAFGLVGVVLAASAVSRSREDS
jgi:hypothetical protein